MGTIEREKMVFYLDWVKKNGLIPNFWMSEEYADKALKFIEVLTTLIGFTSVDMFSKDVELDWFFPVIGKTTGIVGFGNYYSSFTTLYENIEEENVFLDYQFIYNPVDFLDLSGSKWKVFRKNIKKYPERCGGELDYRAITDDGYFKDLESLLLSWCEGKTIYDNEVMIRYVFQGENRWGLFNHGKLVGLNIFDENFKFVNFRYCIDDGTPFLNEFMRYLFYTSEVVQSKDKLVNDGGSLDNEGLHQFKKKLNPCQIGKVYSRKETQ